jgi:ParB family chromosome partitioning protein
MQAVTSINDRKNQSEIVVLAIGRLIPHPLNPRGPVSDDDVLELMRSIREQGILQPLLVVPFNQAFHIVAGHRRHRAAKLAGLTELPCIVREFSEEEQEEVMLTENLQRQDLTIIQEARAFQRFVDRRFPIARIVERIGVSAGYIESRLRVLQLEKSVQQLFEMNLLPIGAAAILTLTSDAGRQKHYAQIAVAQRLPLHKLEELIRGAETKPKKAPGRSGTHQQRKKVLGNYEVFTRSEAVHELQREGSASYQSIAEAFNDICDGICVEEDGNREMCESCPAPRLIASLLRRNGVEIKGSTTQ